MDIPFRFFNVAQLAYFIINYLLFNLKIIIMVSLLLIIMKATLPKKRWNEIISMQVDPCISFNSPFLCPNFSNSSFWGHPDQYHHQQWQGNLYRMKGVWTWKAFQWRLLQLIIPLLFLSPLPPLVLFPGPVLFWDKVSRLQTTSQVEMPSNPFAPTENADKVPTSPPQIQASLSPINLKICR